jgi:pSer/pThr/pTyr-binding forkhead associated (FHA) protein
MNKDHSIKTRLQIGSTGDAPGNSDGLVTIADLKRVVGRLTVVDGPAAGKFWELRSTTTSIGRDARNDIQLEWDDTVHRKAHAAIEFVGNGFRLHNMQRGNPVTVNGEAVGKHHDLAFGDRIGIGSTTLRLDPPSASP